MLHKAIKILYSYFAFESSPVSRTTWHGRTSRNTGIVWLQNFTFWKNNNTSRKYINFITYLFFDDFCWLATQRDEIEHCKHRQIFAKNPDKIVQKRLRLKHRAWNCLHWFLGRFFNENKPNHNTKSMNVVLDVLMIDPPTDISEDCHQTS